MKRILLVNPIYNCGTIPRNIPLSKLATGLNCCGHETSCIDFVRPECERHGLDFFRQEEKAFVCEVAEAALSVDVVYITTGTGNELKPYPLFPRIKDLAETIKRKGKAKVIVGGALINLYIRVYNIPQSVICDSNIDELVVGDEYYETMRLMAGDCAWPASVIPNWSIWRNTNYPFYKSVQFVVGCPFSCDFCFEGKIFNNHSNSTTIEDFISSISYDEKIVVEDSVLISNKYFDKIMNGLEAKRVHFAAYVRISEIVNKPDYIKRMHQSGCQSVIVGIETLDSEMLSEHKKNILYSEIREALDLLRDNEINVQGCFMLGFPTDSLENMERTIEFAINEKLNGYRWHIYQPNYSQCPQSLYINNQSETVDVQQLLKVQLNVPDCCLPEIMELQPEISKLDEHFMFRAKNHVGPEAFDSIGYRNNFSLGDVKRLIDSMFPAEWILNEEVLYKELFN